MRTRAAVQAMRRSGIGVGRILLTWAAAGATLAPAAAHAQRRPPAGLDQYVERALGEWGVPGLALAVIDHDSVVYAKGYGVRRLGDRSPVDERTMFAIGSSTKTFTSAALALLVDERKLDWDARAASVLPGFELADPVATKLVTVRDMLSHRTGLPGENLLFWGTSLTREQILARLRYLPLRSSPRSRYEYQNLMFLAAGQVVPAVTGRSWDDFVTERLLEPLGMSRTTTRVAAVGRFDNVASPHAVRDGVMRPIPWLDLDNAGPAGSMISTVTDMAQWVRLHLGDGTYRGRRIISKEAMAEMHSPQMVIPPELPYTGLMPDAHFRLYGLGWMMHDYHGKLIIEHGGQTDGMHGTVAMMPEEGLGVVVLTNSVLFGLPAAIGYRVFDGYLGRPERDWSAEIKRSLVPMNEGDRRPPPTPKPNTKPSLAPAKYAGVYRHPLYGDATVAMENGALVLSLLGLKTKLTHWELDTFATDWPLELEREVLPFATFVVTSPGTSGRLVFPDGTKFVRKAR